MKKIFLFFLFPFLLSAIDVTVKAQGTRPDQLANLQLWIRADSTTLTYADGATIDSVKNLGAVGGWFIQATGANQPLFRSSVSQTEKPGIDFDGSNDNLAMPSSTASFNFLHTSSDNTLIAVFMFDAVSGSQIVYHNHNYSGTGVGSSLLFVNGQVNPNIFNGTANQLPMNIISPETLSVNIVYFATITHDENRNPNWIERIDGVNRHTSEDIFIHSASNATQNFTLGRSALSFNGKLLELFAYNDLKTPAEIDSLELYIRNKYYSSFSALTFIPRESKPRNPNAPTGTWADSLIRAYAFSPADSARVDSIRDWSPKNIWAIETAAPAGGPGNLWAVEIGEHLGYNVGGREDRSLSCGNLSTLGITDQLTVVQRVKLTANHFTNTGMSLSLYDDAATATEAVRFDDIDFAGDAANFCINTGTETCSNMTTLGVSTQIVTILGTYDGDSIRVWVNGVRKDQDLKSGNISVSDFPLLGIGRDRTNFWLGEVLMTCIWKRVLTDAEIAEITDDSYVMFRAATASGSGRRGIVQ